MTVKKENVLLRTFGMWNFYRIAPKIESILRNPYAIESEKII